MSKRRRGVSKRWIVDVKKRRNAGGPRTRREGTIENRSALKYGLWPIDGILIFAMDWSSVHVC